MSKNYKIVVPKAGADDESGTSIRLYALDEIVVADEEWKQELMSVFVANNWAIETKMDAPEETGDPVRARNDDGSYKADDPATPENEAWEGGEAPKPKTRRKRQPKKKSTE